MVLWFGQNKLTMFGAHCPFNPLNQLAESKVINLTRVEAPFSKSRMSSISRIELEKTAQPKKTASPALLPTADSPAGIYRQAARLTPNPAQRDLLEKQVQDLPRWRETLEHWMAHRWNPRNLPGMLDLYRRGGASGCRYCPKPETPKTAEAFKQLREQYETVGRPGSPIPVARLAGCGTPAGGLAAAGRAE